MLIWLLVGVRYLLRCALSDGDEMERGRFRSSGEGHGIVVPWRGGRMSTYIRTAVPWAPTPSLRSFFFILSFFLSNFKLPFFSFFYFIYYPMLSFVFFPSEFAEKEGLRWSGYQPENIPHSHTSLSPPRVAYAYPPPFTNRRDVDARPSTWSWSPSGRALFCFIIGRSLWKNSKKKKKIPMVGRHLAKFISIQDQSDETQLLP